MGSLEEFRGQEGTFIKQRSSSAHSRGDLCQAEVCWGLCHRGGEPLAPCDTLTHIPSLLLLQRQVSPTVKRTLQTNQLLTASFSFCCGKKKKKE